MGRIMGKALIVAALACPLAFTSCVGELKDSIEELNNRVTALEKKLADEVDALKALINGKVTVADLTTEGGVTTLTLSDGKTVKITEGIAGAALITVKESDGVMYWATTVNGGDAEFLLDASGNMVPVSANITPLLKVEDGKWYISLDGGTNWTYSGYEEVKEEVIVFTAASADDDYVYLTLADGTVVKLLKDKNVAFKALTGKQCFAAGETKSIKMAVEGIKDYTVTEKPAGWKVVLEGDKLKVTAPAEGEGDVDGVIKVLATVEGSSPIIAKVAVTTDPDFTLSLSGKNVSFTLAEKNVGNWDYLGYAYGVLKASEFSSEAAIAYIKNNYAYGCDNYESKETTIEELVGETYDPEESYVVFATNFIDRWSGLEYSEEDIQFVIYEPVKVEISAEVFIDNANLTVKVSGCEGYYGACEYVEWYEPEYLVQDLGGRWGPQLITSDYSGPAGLFAGGYSSKLDPDTDYVVWVVPQNPEETYTADMVREYRFKTPALVAGASFEAPKIEIKDVTVESVSAEVTAVEGAYKTFAAILNIDQVEGISDEELVKNVMNANQFAESGTFNVQKTWLEPGDKVVAVAVAVAADGKYGQIAKVESAAKNLEFSETLKVSITSVEPGMSDAKVKLAFEGTPVSIRYVNTSASYGIDDMENQLALNQRSDAVNVDVNTLVDNTIELTELSIGTEYYFCVIAIDADGNISHMAKENYAPESDIVYIRKSKDETAWAVGKPSLGNEQWEGGWTFSWGNWYPSFAELTVDITMPENCKKAYVWACDPENLLSDTELSISDKTVVYGIQCESSKSVYIERVMQVSHIYIVWIDSEDKYHSYDEYIPTFPEQPTEVTE